MINMDHLSYIKHISKDYPELHRELSKMDDLATATTFICENADKKSYIYAYASKCNPDGKHWIRLRAMIGGKVIKTASDAGGVLVGNDDFQILIPNLRGDGITRVAFVEKDDWNSAMANFWTNMQNTAEGRPICVYGYDCGTDDVAATIVGRVGIYAYDGIVVFEKWD